MRKVSSHCRQLFKETARRGRAGSVPAVRGSWPTLVFIQQTFQCLVRTWCWSGVRETEVSEVRPSPTRMLPGGTATAAGADNTASAIPGPAGAPGRVLPFLPLKRAETTQHMGKGRARHAEVLSNLSVNLCARAQAQEGLGGSHCAP